MVTEQDELVTVNAYNIRLTGNLLIRKIVENADGSLLTDGQMQTDFTFEVTFSDGKSYDYRIDGGMWQSLINGTTLTLRHGQTAEFKDLHAGILYNVVEVSAENYITTSSGSRGEYHRRAIDSKLCKYVQYGGTSKGMYHLSHCYQTDCRRTFGK